MDKQMTMSAFSDEKLHLEEKLSNLLNTLMLVYEQRLYMYENRKHSVANRMVHLKSITHTTDSWLHLYAKLDIYMKGRY